MKLISWNIDSLNAGLTASSDRGKMTFGVLEDIAQMKPDVLGLQETKLKDTGPTKQHLKILNELFPDYEIVWSSSHEPARKGYSGTMFLYKKELQPKAHFPQIGAPSTMDDEGRIITLEFDNFYLTEVYTPNAGTDLKRLPEREIWDDHYRAYLQGLDKDKPVLACGDFNVAHEEIDLKNPASNRKSAGFTIEERTKFTSLLAAGFTDTFRYLHGNIPDQYTWWAQRSKTSKINNSGWRIDYWLVSNRLADKVEESAMINSGDRQDHTPVILEINL
ncbi:exodeoxyribonuclease III [Streptococcaceae bacterium ESL0687]|nr:exodeoxyribonuclease III [Streptococcaceae bacterium ESL0687]